MNVKKVVFFAANLAFIALAAFGCASNSSEKLIKKGLYNCNGRFETAMKRIEKKNYGDAIRIFDEIKYQCGGSSLMDTVYYHTAMSHFRLKQYSDARVEFENLMLEFPRSSFVEETRYRLGQMMYLRSNKSGRDQTETHEAIRLLSDYAELYPNGAYVDSARHFQAQAIEKLAEKEFRNAVFYSRQKEYEAALIYYRSLLARHPQSKFSQEALVGSVEALAALGQVEDARELIEELEYVNFAEPLKKRLETVIMRLDQPLNAAGASARNRRSKESKPQTEVKPVKAPEVPAEQETVEVLQREQSETAEEKAVDNAESQQTSEPSEKDNDNSADAEKDESAEEKSEVDTEKDKSPAEKADGNNADTKKPEAAAGKKDAEVEKAKSAAEKK